MDPLTSIGSILPRHQQRDAIHVAVAPVIARERLRPGQHIGVTPAGVAGDDGNPVGIVDPFLREDVKGGERFWMFMYPNTIKSIRHEWSHPAFDRQYSESERWIRDFAASIPLDYAVLMLGADQWVRSKERGGWGDYLCFGGLLEGESVPDEFWPHYENVTGTTVAEAHRESFFTCSC